VRRRPPPTSASSPPVGHLPRPRPTTVARRGAMRRCAATLTQDEQARDTKRSGARRRHSLDRWTEGRWHSLDRRTERRRRSLDQGAARLGIRVGGGGKTSRGQARGGEGVREGAAATHVGVKGSGGLQNCCRLGRPWRACLCKIAPPLLLAFGWRSGAPDLSFHSLHR
jgi:hypothetical protein